MKLKLMLCALVIVAAIQTVGAPARAQNCTRVVESAECKFGLPAGQYDALFGAMQANPAPAVSALEANPDELRRFSFSKLAKGQITVYDAPNGKPIGKLDVGFQFTTILSRSGDWIEIEAGKWVTASAVEGVSASPYAGVLFNGGLPFPMAWIINFTRSSQVPGGKGVGAVLPLHQRVYIYASVNVGQWEWYLIGPGQWINQRMVARPTPTGVPDGVSGRWISVDIYEQSLVAYDGGTPVFTTLVSTGVNPFGTRYGVYSIWARKDTDAMSGSMGGDYSLPFVPYVMYFDKDIALHGTYWHNSFGRKHSRGCVNVSVTDARWLYDFTSGGAFVYVWRSR
jgi:hypothetical protein